MTTLMILTMTSLDKGVKENQKTGQSSVGEQKDRQTAGLEDQFSAGQDHDRKYVMISTLNKFRDVISSEILDGLEKEIQNESAIEEVGRQGMCCDLEEQQDLDRILEWGKRVLNDARGSVSRGEQLSCGGWDKWG
jgi:hypothetical protein